MKCISFVGCLFALTLSVVAQPVPEPPPEGLVRIWNFSQTTDRPLAVFLSKTALQAEDASTERELIWLGRGMKSAQVSSYVTVPEGEYSLLAVPEFRTFFEMGEPPEKRPKISAKDQLIQGSDKLPLKAGAVLTVILEDAPSGKLSARCLQDHLVGEVKQLRAVNAFKNGVDGKLHIRANNTLVPLWASIPRELESKPNPLQKNRVTVVFEYVRKSGPSMLRDYQIDFAGIRSASLIFHADRYGRPTLSVVGDAPLKLPTEEQGEEEDPEAISP